MLKPLASLLRRLGSSGSGSLATLAVLAVSLLFPLLGLKCTHSRLEDLRADYRALQSERASLESGLALCREAAGLSDAVLVARERENREITNKYNRLREELLRGLTPTTEDNDALQESGADYASWCVQPVPRLLRGLLVSGGAAAPLPGAAGPAAHGDGSAAAAKP